MIALYWIVGVIAYLGIALYSARLILRWVMSDGLGIEDFDIIMACLTGMLFPVSVPVAWVAFAPKAAISPRIRKLLVP